MRELSGKVASAEGRAYEMSTALQQQITDVSELDHIAETSSRQISEVHGSLQDIEKKSTVKTQVGKLA